MRKICTACGKPLQGSLQIGGTLLCRTCGPIISQEITRLREEEKPVNVLHIAMRHFREVSDPQAYPLRDIPGDLWTAAKHAAVEEQMSLRELLLDALRRHPAVQKHDV